MRRWILYAAMAVLLFLLAPIQKTDVGDLQPVELLYIYKEDGVIYVETDTEDLGTGKSLREALGNLKATTAGKLFLETADYLIVTKDTVGLLSELERCLRPTTEVCLGIHADTKATDFLSTHKPGVTLNDLRSGQGWLPTLIKTEERYRLVSENDF